MFVLSLVKKHYRLQFYMVRGACTCVCVRACVRACVCVCAGAV